MLPTCFMFADWESCFAYNNQEEFYETFNPVQPPNLIGVRTREVSKTQHGGQMLTQQPHKKGFYLMKEKTAKKKFPCPNCPSGFSYERGLVQHLKYECGQKPRYKCPYCKHRSKWLNNVYKHIRSLHIGAEVRYITSPNRN